jgi:peptidyl-prolyl cis-trans isomerase SurA
VIKIRKIIFIFTLILLNFNNANALIKDSIYITIENEVITQSDIIDEIKMLLILSDQSYDEKNKDQLRSLAVKSVIRRSIKKIGIKRYNVTNYNKIDLNNELKRLASNLNTDLKNFKKKFEDNKIEYSKITEQVKIDLMWNSLIFNLYKNMIVINLEDVEEKLKLTASQSEINEYLISEIIIQPNENTKVETQITEVKKKIKNEGFEKTAMDLSIAESSLNGGNLGWLQENTISNNFKNQIINTMVGEVSEPVYTPGGIIFFKVRDLRKKKITIDLEKTKNNIVNNEKQKILNMHSLSHYENLKQSITIDFY